MKTMASKRKEKEPEQPHSSRFLSRKHEKHFKVVQDRRLLMERKVGMIPNFAPQFGEQLLGNDWGKLATYPTPANIAVVKEFYTNERKIGDYPAENYLGYVRGHAIRYDPDSINNFLDTMGWNRTGSVVNIRRTDLTPLAKYWMAFSHANIQPCSHVSDITLSWALLLYCAIRNLNVNIGQIAGVDTSAQPFERPRKEIDEAYYRQYCGGEEAAQPVPPHRTRRERGQAQSQASAETHEVEPFQMRDMYMSLIGAQLQSIHRGQVATTEIIVGMYDTPLAHRWTMEEFHNVVPWLEEKVQGDRAEAAKASAMEMDEDDAFEDTEDEEEEEDIVDNSD
ncbi:hypothetical protein LR48_Vigan34s000600 [Vigna angularis]|uniref:Putative plant transposon protein domain-containing protein n=1 Tax=Phaseolus angularis TaxID=3914 RepID=A0A0L9T331_PHAAN|nr:hypothetical protein LR48_Vigan34s000600 [Vigna angularis]